MSLDEFRERLAASETRALLPSAKTLDTVAARVRALGFEVLDNLVFPKGIPGLAVFARGRVALFESVFRTRLATMTRKSTGDQASDRELSSTGIVVAEGAPDPSPDPLGPGAILVSVAEPPVLAETVATVGTATDTEVCLALSDVAHETHADEVHQRDLLLRGRANGSGVRVAVVDTGFAMHPFFDAYHVTRIAGPYASGSGLGDEHGTQVLANLLACAPGVDAWAVKYFKVDTAFATAMLIPKVRVISLSWVFPIGSNPRPSSILPLEYFVQVAVSYMGIAVVAASGYRTGETTPARLHEVIAVGGAKFVSPPPPSAWGNSSAFTSTIYGTRMVPDLCGLASQINMPVPEPPAGWDCQWGSTSCATPQVAGVAALLLQKNPTLSPWKVRGKLMSFATDITSGFAFSGDPAGPGKDAATGAGFVNAIESWKHVVDAWWTLFWP
jgi:subtilisin family serine protease